MRPLPAPPLAGLLGAPLLLAAGVGACLLVFQRPEPIEGAAAGGFSAGRAATYLPYVAEVPRPVGSEHHDAVRRWIVTEIEAAGLMPAVQAASVDGETLTNVLVRVPGRESTGAVLFLCHYDSRPDTPGASDDGMAVVALLQVLDKLTFGQALRNDLIFLFTDGEELGLRGARLFADQHDWMEDVACAVNFDAIGCGGTLVMFQTGPGSGALLDHYAAVARHPVASSLAPAVYARLPRETDFTVLREHGLPGLNFAIVGGASVYHGPGDTHRAVDRATLQLLGDTALDLARELGEADLGTLPREDRTYFDVFGRRLVSYGEVPSLVVSGLALLALVAASVVVLPKKRSRLLGLAKGLGGFALFVVATGALGTATWFVVDELVAMFAEPVGEPGSDLESSSWTLGGLAAFALLAATMVLSYARRDLLEDRPGAWLVSGGLLTWALFLTVLALEDVHAGAQLVPAALVVGAMALLTGGRPHTFLLFVASVVACLLVAPTVAIVFHVLATDPLVACAAGALVSALVAGLFLPYLAALRHGRFLRVLLGLGSLGALVWGALLRSQGS